MTDRITALEDVYAAVPGARECYLAKETLQLGLD